MTLRVGCIKQQETGLLRDYAWVAAEPLRMQKVGLEMDANGYGSANICVHIQCVVFIWANNIRHMCMQLLPAAALLSTTVVIRATYKARS